ncbi:MAG TPA: hypothetical protein PK263_01310 [bacterium]|nr:hypothetical protein [bacterium]
MKSRKEAVFDVLEEDRKYEKLVKEYEGNQSALNKADFLYQEGVRVGEIERALREEK